MQVVDLADKLTRITEHWRPKIVAELNGQEVKLAKLQGEFVWHTHALEDELFLVVTGELRVDWRDASGEHSVKLRPGQLVVVPRGVEHRPVADRECSILLFEPASTVNTGTAGGARTVAKPDWI